ncbi:tripartite tricarboxylate transporter TctB family protein [uncultured Aeromicrobium sp.]|uniref:tripartite tricarboxylate transporter TctB family protein n=1 Tax=uncultured Aeromicrobium sp. TaxID=337820 RepID=UPI0025EBB11B|nr:tripartite tricarboxylate transporter TctB family protein [uncultured Aeromicrobium sp.]
MSQTTSATSSGPLRATARGGERSWRISPKAWFLIGTMVVFGIYTDMAFDLEWQTAAGRIGPGYFPRLIGLIAIVVAAIALVIDLRSDTHEVVDLEDEVGDAPEHLGRHPMLLTIFVAICAVYVASLVPLGAIVATLFFLLATLILLDPAHKVRGVVIATGVTVLLFLAFETGLNVGLPGGVLDLI